jgi:UDP-N-acetylmuramate dehydrogenase
MKKLDAPDILACFLKKKFIYFYRNYDISNEFYSKTGSTVDYFIIPKCILDLSNLISFLYANKLSFKVLGGGTNTLFLDSLQYSIFISTKLLTNINFASDYVSVESGKLMSDFVSEVVKREYTGFEGLEGIPGSIGGALFMNAGAYGYTISQHLVSVKVLGDDGELYEYDKKELIFDERTSSFKTNLSKKTIVSMKFLLKKGVYDAIEEKISLYHVLRHSSLEYCYPNLGSIYALPTSDIYNKIKYPFLADLFFKIFYRLYYSRLSLILKRKKNPTKKLFNSFVFYFYPELKAFNVHSRKTINTFVNKNKTSLEILRYILELKKGLGNDVEIENEIVLSPICKITHDSDYQNSIEIYKEIQEIHE